MLIVRTYMFEEKQPARANFKYLWQKKRLKIITYSSCDQKLEREVMKKKELNYLYKFNIKSFLFFREQENRETIDKLDEEENTNNVSKDKR